MPFSSDPSTSAVDEDLERSMQDSEIDDHLWQVFARHQNKPKPEPVLPRPKPSSTIRRTTNSFPTPPQSRHEFGSSSPVLPRPKLAPTIRRTGNSFPTTPRSRNVPLRGHGFGLASSSPVRSTQLQNHSFTPSSPLLTSSSTTSTFSPLGGTYSIKPDYLLPREASQITMVYRDSPPPPPFMLSRDDSRRTITRLLPPPPREANTEHGYGLPLNLKRQRVDSTMDIHMDDVPSSPPPDPRQGRRPIAAMRMSHTSVYNSSMSPSLNSGFDGNGYGNGQGNGYGNDQGNGYGNGNGYENTPNTPTHKITPALLPPRPQALRTPSTPSTRPTKRPRISQTKSGSYSNRFLNWLGSRGKGKDRRESEDIRWAGEEDGM